MKNQKFKYSKSNRKSRQQRNAEGLMKLRGGPLNLDQVLERMKDDRIYRRASKGMKFEEND
jgi:hypothetical protein